MPRTARIVIPNVPHHVTQRGNNRPDVFFTADDRRVYLELLLQRCTADDVAVLGYCLMTNHVHLLLRIGSIPLFTIMRRVLRSSSISQPRS